MRILHDRLGGCLIPRSYSYYSYYLMKGPIYIRIFK